MRLKELDYNGNYDAIEPVYESDNEEICYFAEASLIDAFINDPKNNNEKDEEHNIDDEITDTSPYYVNVVRKFNGNYVS